MRVRISSSTETTVPEAPTSGSSTPPALSLCSCSGKASLHRQLFFTGSVSHAVYRTRYYKARGQADTSNAADNIYERGSLLQLTKRKGAASYIGRKTLVVNTA